MSDQKTYPPDFLERLLGNQMFHAKGDSLIHVGNNPMLVTSALGSDFPCPACGGTLHRVHMPLTGPYSGSVVCSACDFRDTVVSFLGKQIFVVESLPPAAPVYVNDGPDEVDDGSGDT